MNCTKAFFSALFCLCTLPALAATPLNAPMGLAVDSKGNLYVANNGSNQILVYSPTGQQLTANTISTHVHAPMQLAFDAQGNLWVSNLMAGTTNQENFTAYGPAGKQVHTVYTTHTGTKFNTPSFAVDWVGDLWISSLDGSGNPFLAVQNGPSPYDGGDLIDGFFVSSGNYTALAARGPWIALGTSGTVSWSLVGSMLGQSADLSRLSGTGNAGNGVVSMTFDNNTNLYFSTDEGLGLYGVWFVNLANGAAPSLNIGVLYRPSGLAVDSIHGRLYLANSATNSIAVYSTSTWLQIGTIQ